MALGARSNGSSYLRGAGKRSGLRLSGFEGVYLHLERTNGGELWLLFDCGVEDENRFFFFDFRVGLRPDYGFLLVGRRHIRFWNLF